MSIDIHVAKSIEEAQRQYPALSITEELHTVIFNNATYSEYKYLYRLKEYYKDNIYLADDIVELIKELEYILNITDNNEVKKFIVDFIEICQKAIKSNLNIYCFCD